jgi:mannose/cellobiose epimerase-like protein (N-acyl-D-glucosamine 2-epimerase family)
MALATRGGRALEHYADRAADALGWGRRLDAGPPPDLATLPARAGHLLADLRRAWPPDRIDPRGGFLVQPMADDAEPTPPWRTFTQARVTWFHASLALAGAGPDHEEAAAWGTRLLQERLWDADHGGFVFELDPDGRATDDTKHLYTHAFALFAVAQWAKGTGGAAALRFANEIFDLIEERWQPLDRRGRPEVYPRQWSAPSGTWRQSYDAPLHLLEACTVLAEATARPVVRAVVADLVSFLGAELARPPCGTCPAVYERGWQAAPPTRHAISYGHECERISMVLRAVDVIGEDPAPWLDRFERLTSHLAAVAVDRRRGGLYFAGPPCRPAWHRQKLWWVQAEALLALHSVHRRRPTPLTAHLLDSTLRWIERHQHDPVTGDWHVEVNGTVPADHPIAGPWKEPYHQGRALLALTDQLR